MNGALLPGIGNPEESVELTDLMPRGRNAVMASRVPTEAGDPDYYPTPPWAARAGGELIRAIDPDARTCWEPACGGGHMAFALRDYFPIVRSSDINDYSDHNPDQQSVRDFLAPDADILPGLTSVDWIVTNPPFVLGEAFIRQAYILATRGVAMLLRLQFLESDGRHVLFARDCPLTFLAPFCERVPMHKGRWEPDGSTTTAYAWFIFCKPVLWATPWHGEARVRFIAPGARARLFKPGDRARFGLPETAQLDLGGETL